MKQYIQKNLPPIRRISEATKTKVVSEFKDVQVDAVDRVITQPEPFGLNKLYDRDSPLTAELQLLLEPSIQKYVLEFFKNDRPKRSDGAEYWRKFIPQSLPPEETKAIQLALSPRYFWGDFIRMPEIRQALAKDAAYALVDNLITTIDFLAGEEQLVEEWKAVRPAYYNFANTSTLEYIGRLYSTADREDPECAEGLRAVWLTRMAAHRILDAHFTGGQVHKPDPRLGGVGFIFRKLIFGFADELEEGVQIELEKKFGFIKIGLVESAKYGETKSKEDIGWLERIYADTDPKAQHGSDRPFQYNHPVSQIASHISPLLCLRPDKIKQKGLDSVKFLYQLYKKAKEVQELSVKSPLPQLDLQNSVLDESRLKGDMVPRFSQTWCRERFLSPSWLEFAGFRTVTYRQSQEALDMVLAGLPDFAELLEQTETVDNLVFERTRKVVLEPVIVRGIQRECYLIFLSINPELAKSYAAATKEKYKEERQLDQRSGVLKEMAELFHKTMDYLCQNQQRVVEILEEKYGVKEEISEPVFVEVKDTMDWLHPLVFPACA